MKQYTPRYNPAFGPIPPQVLRKLELSYEAYESHEKRTVRCPICGFSVLRVNQGQQGCVEIKCQKCKFTGPLNLAFFRTQHIKRPQIPFMRARHRAYQKH